MAGHKASVLRDQPLVSIGVPVRNGEAYIQEALGSLLSQSYRNLEIIVSDNGSTDGTRDICEACAAADKRVRYHRQASNRGAAWNFNFVFHQSRGHFFKWAAHDDLLQPDFILNTWKALCLAPDAVAAYGSVSVIDHLGRICAQDPEPSLQLDHLDPVVRFRDAVFGHHYCIFIFGLLRTEALRKTALIGPYASSDVVLLGQLALLGPILKIAGEEFLWRSHPQQSIRRVLHAEGLRAYGQWFNPQLSKGRHYPHWRLLRELISCVLNSPLRRSEKLRCLLHILTNRYRLGGRKELLLDLLHAWKPNPNPSISEI